MCSALLLEGVLSDSQAFLCVGLCLTDFLALAAFVVTFSVVTLALGTLRAASSLHIQLLQNILKCSMSFFDTTPVGRIINRFGKDVDVIDNSIPVSIRAWINCLFSVNWSTIWNSVCQFFSINFILHDFIYFFNLFLNALKHVVALT